MLRYSGSGRFQVRLEGGVNLILAVPVIAPHEIYCPGVNGRLEYLLLSVNPDSSILVCCDIADLQDVLP